MQLKMAAGIRFIFRRRSAPWLRAWSCGFAVYISGLTAETMKMFLKTIEDSGSRAVCTA